MFEKVQTTRDKLRELSQDLRRAESAGDSEAKVKLEALYSKLQPRYAQALDRLEVRVTEQRTKLETELNALESRIKAAEVRDDSEEADCLMPDFEAVLAQHISLVDTARDLIGQPQASIRNHQRVSA